MSYTEAVTKRSGGKRGIEVEAESGRRRSCSLLFIGVILSVMCSVFVFSSTRANITKLQQMRVRVHSYRYKHITRRLEILRLSALIILNSPENT